MEVYLDNSATTPLYNEVIEYMASVQADYYGNPSSLHRKGVEAEREINRARREVAAVLGVSPEEIFFTSGGTESNNMAIKGIAHRYHRRGKHVVTTEIEHPSVMNTFRQLEQEGFNVSFARVNEDGIVDHEHLISLLDAQTTLVSVIYVNNETGVIQDHAGLGRAIKKKNKNIVFHVDGVQALGKVKLSPMDDMVDLLSLSAHKIHGPKGAGALWIRKGTALQPLFQGGDQEKGLRPGTENLAGIAGFGKAVSLIFSDTEKQIKRIAEMKNMLYNKLNESLDIKLNGPPVEKGAPHILNLSFRGIKGEVLVHALEEQGIFSSPGSACHSRRPEPSHVLAAMGTGEEDIKSALRFSFSSFNTSAEVEHAAGVITDSVKNLREIMA